MGSQSCCGWVGSRGHPVGEDKEVGSRRLAAGIQTLGRLGRGAVHSALAVAMQAWASDLPPTTPPSGDFSIALQLNTHYNGIGTDRQVTASQHTH